MHQDAFLKLDEAAEERRWISQTAAREIAEIEHFRDSEYRSADVNALLDFYVLNFVDPLMAMMHEAPHVADIGTGYGWLAIAFALRTNARVVAVEQDNARLRAARKIATVLGVEDRIQWTQGSIAELPLEDRAFDAVYCIEVIEHTGVNRNYIRELARVTNDILVITTPNKLFPIINHDTALPFCHWLPLRLRDHYAARFGKSSLQQNNMFWSPTTLLSSLEDFDRISRFMQFEDYRTYRNAEKLLNGRSGKTANRCKSCYFFLVSKLGKHAIFFVPNLASTFRRRR